MTEEHELRIPAKEVSRVALECECGAEITIEFSREGPRETDWKDKGLRCPVCPKSFSAKLKLALNDFAGWISTVEESGEKVFFRIKKTMPD